MTAVICGNDRNWLEYLLGMLRKEAITRGGEVDLKCCNSMEELVVAAEGEPEALFIDCRISGSNIHKCNSSIGNMFPNCQIIFVTGDDEEASNSAGLTDMYGKGRICCIADSQLDNQLDSIIERIEALDAEIKSDLIVRTTDGMMARIRCSDINYIERKNRKTTIFTNDELYQLRSRLPEIMKKLPYAYFARCHSSFAVNLNRVREIHNHNLVLEDGTELMISRGFSKSFRLRYMNLIKDSIID